MVRIPMILRENMYRPHWWIDTVAPKVYNRVIGAYFKKFGPDVCSIMDEDWDNLILLDACRYDMFKDLSHLDGNLNSRISKGSATPEFLEANFANRIFHDTVYVTANPMYRLKNLEGTFHAIIDVWNNNWDDELNTVHPDSMVEATMYAYERYPNKRIFAHFMQPHYPFIGDAGQKLEDHSGYEATYRRVQDEESHRDAPTVWELLRQGRVSKQEAWEAYNENLEIVLPHVERLISGFDGRTVVTSDHGNMLGEYIIPFPKKLYGHPEGIHTKKLVKVPWLVREKGNRKEVTIEETGKSPDQDVSKEVSARLSDLGYADL